MKSRALLPILVFLVLHSFGFAQDTPDSLRGLAGVAVSVQGITPEDERDGLSRATLQTDVELRLRLAGIRVLTGEQVSNEPGRPQFIVLVLVYKATGNFDGYAKSIMAEMRQDVWLARNPSVVLPSAITWSSGRTVGLSNSGALQNDIRQNVADRVDEFINAFLAANPK